MINGFSSSPTAMLIPESRTTSCSLFLRSLIKPNLGTRIRISIPFSCMACGIFLTNSATSQVCRKGSISLATYRIRIFDMVLDFIEREREMSHKSTQNSSGIQESLRDNSYICDPLETGLNADFHKN